MSKFSELYSADLSRYGGKAVAYIKVFHYLHRRTETTSFVPLKTMYKFLYRLWTGLRGLEIPANNSIGGVFIWDMPTT